MFVFEYNQDMNKAAQAKQAVIRNGGYCPTKKEHTINNRCVCKQFRDSITEGLCDCGLYYKRLLKEESEEE